MKYRDHRGGLRESMATEITVNTLQELKDHLSIKRNKEVKDIEFKYSCYDYRTEWDTYYVIVDGVVAGMSDGDFKTRMKKKAHINLNFESIDSELTEGFTQLITSGNLNYTDENGDYHYQEINFEDRDLLKEKLVEFIDKVVYCKFTVKDIVNNPKHVSKNKSYLKNVLDEFTLDVRESRNEEDVIIGMEWALTRAWDDQIQLGDGVFCEKILPKRIDEMLKNHESLMHYDDPNNNTVPITIEYIVNGKFMNIKVEFLKK